MDNVSNWVLGAMSAMMALAGLFVASHVGHGVGYYGGLGMFVFCTMFIMHLMKTSFDHA